MGIGGLILRLTAYFRHYWRSGLIIAVTLLMEMGFNSLLPFSFKYIVDDGLVGRNQVLLITILTGLAVGVIVVSLAGLGRDYLYARVTTLVLGDIRYRMFRHLQRLSMDFYMRARTGDILARFSGDLATVETAIANAISWGILPALDVAANTVLLFYLNWQLSLVAMLVWPLALFGPRFFTPHAVRASYVRKDNEGRTLSRVQENIASQPVVKALGLQEHSINGFDDANQQLSHSLLRVSFFGSLADRSATVGIMLLQVTVLASGAWMASQDLITVGTLTAFQALFLNLSYSLSYAAQFVPTLVQATGGMQRIEDLLAESPHVTDARNARMLPPIEREIRLEHVNFGYVPDRANLKDVSLVIPAGSSVAFVGASGSGKSTILNLIMRLYDPLEGKVSIDGNDLTEVVQWSLRSQMSVVFQESFLFNTTIAENIRLGRLDASMQEIIAAARDAEIHEQIIQLPSGYDTLVGERGGRLSGGQRQRIAIARAMLRNPRMLLLDEATSALDPATEASIGATLERLGRGRTLLTVTHRLASVVSADCIHVLDDGVLMESGTHEELLARRGYYHRLWSKQSGISLSADGEQAWVTVERLRAAPILGELDEPLLAEVARLFVTEHHAAGRTVIYEGEPGDRFYIVVRGAVEVLKTGVGAVQHRVSVLQDGDFFGEIALLRSVPRTASVRTMVRSIFLSLQRDQFNYVLERAPRLREQLETANAGRLAEEAQTARRLNAFGDRRD